MHALREARHIGADRRAADARVALQAAAHERPQSPLDRQDLLPCRGKNDDFRLARVLEISCLHRAGDEDSQCLEPATTERPAGCQTSSLPAIEIANLLGSACSDELRTREPLLECPNLPMAKA